MNSETTATRFGEVVETAVESLIGQCYRLYEAPPLGTLVRAGSDVFAVVSGIATSALDPSRRVIARGADAATEAEVYAANPQLERLLRTDVTLTVVGYCTAGAPVHQYLPPLPPRIHTFLYTCDTQEVRAFFGDGTPHLDFMSLLLASYSNTDDVLAATLRQAAVAFDDPRSFLVDASKAVAVLLTGDVMRVNAIVRRLPINEVGR
ncbi:MAG: hypothetical protein O3B65_03245 [Chloroflexi bacterium]|nr:hypothetical protein [Chloroflexota bacterium]